MARGFCLSSLNNYAGFYKICVMNRDSIPHRTLDARGLMCPMPSVKTALVLEGMESGEILEVITDDPVSKRDLPAWAESTGNRVVAIEEDRDAIRIYLEKP